METTIDYSQYTLDELYDVRNHIDRERYPDRFKMLLDEIEKRENEIERREEAEGTETPPRKLWIVRAEAFAIDYVIFMFLWTVIDNLIIFSVPKILLLVGSTVVFCVYFAVTEGVAPAGASFGKQLRSLGVVAQGGERPPIASALLRAAIVAAIFVFDWQSLISFFPLPVLLSVLAWTIPAGLSLYNIWLAVFTEENLMFQDRLTSTKVASSSHVVLIEAGNESIFSETRLKISRATLAFAIVAGASFLGAVGTQILYHSVAGTSLWSISQAQPDSLAASMEKAIFDEFNIRSEVSLTSSISKSASFSAGEMSSTTVRELEVKIWIPALSWREARRQKLIEVALNQLSLSEGYYDSGVVSIWTGSKYLKFGRTFSLEL